MNNNIITSKENQPSTPTHILQSPIKHNSINLPPLETKDPNDSIPETKESESEPGPQRKKRKLALIPDIDTLPSQLIPKKLNSPGATLRVRSLSEVDKPDLTPPRSQANYKPIDESVTAGNHVAMCSLKDEDSQCSYVDIVNEVMVTDTPTYPAKIN
ncbi:hypothetical protein WICPIJ_000118 [Wickerhamomyces pijperi]|uniref:Uncharacterized protein n=1 Tax=Wickerhamomyces pijperi TaxID=599730 RepID=A0A9P8QDE6_WICPI|nr:hypothetical protein WICPIJ_000118 [Wickerhamomyces pijperi]